MKIRLLSLLLILLWPIGLNSNLDETLLTWITPPPEAAENLLLAGPPLAGTDVFSDVTESAKIEAVHQASWNEFSPDEPFTSGYMGIGQAWGDYNNDGWADLYVTGNLGSNMLFHNRGDGKFVIPRTAPSISLSDAKSGGATWADYDNDGWRDLYVINDGPNVLFRNEGGTRFVDVTRVAGVGNAGKGGAATWGDYDGDGFLDLYVANWTCFPECNPLSPSRQRDTLFHNNGDGTFRDVSHLLTDEKLEGAAFSASFLDYDNDGDLDLYVVNDQTYNPVGNVLWRNDGRGCEEWCWTDVSAEAGVDLLMGGTGLAVGDYDDDADLDLFVANRAGPMVLFQNQGDGAFVDATAAAGVTIDQAGRLGWGATFFDYDNDGWLDLFVATTAQQGGDDQAPLAGIHFPDTSLLFRNSQNGTFSQVTADEPPRGAQAADEASNAQPTMSVAAADYDHDGWVDLSVGNWNSGYRLYRNEGKVGQDNHWLTIRLIGGGPVNRDAVGARVFVTGSDGRVQMRTVQSGSGFGTNNDSALHFGLGQATVAEVTVVWPNGFKHQFTDAPTDQVWQVIYPTVGIGRPQNATWIIAFLVVVVVLALLLANWKRYISLDAFRFEQP